MAPPVGQTLPPEAGADLVLTSLDQLDVAAVGRRLRTLVASGREIIRVGGGDGRGAR